MYGFTGQFLDEENGWIVLRKDADDNIRDTSFLYRTTNGGESWELNHVNPPNDIEYGAAMFMSVYFKDEMHGWVLGDGLLDYTIDGGETWINILHNEDSPSNHDIMRAMTFSNDDEAYIVGYGAWIQKSEDGGVTWTDQHYYGEVGVTDDYYMTDVVFLNENKGFGAVRHGMMQVTENGGETWTEIFTGYPHDNNAIVLDSYNTLWSAAGDYCTDTSCHWTSALLYSEDFGETWVAIVDDYFSNRYSDIVWPAENYGFTCNLYGEIYKIERENLGISDEDINAVLALYPNPANDLLTVKTSVEFEFIEIFNALGELCLSSNQNQLNISNLDQGIYHVVLRDQQGNRLGSQKLIKN